MLRGFAVAVVAFVAVAFGADACLGDEGGIRPYAKNPYYWQYHGEPVLLLGGSDDDNLFQWPELEAQLDAIAAAGGNFIRNTMSDRPDQGFEVYPYREVGEGKYDLDAWNEVYWERFEAMLRGTHAREIFVQIEVWDRFDLTDSKGLGNWQRHPYNPRNNVNYTYEASGFAKRYPDHPGQNRQPFYFSTPEQRDNRLVLEYQRRFVAKMLSHSLKYDHVLYCMDNETSAEEAWGAYWAAFIREAAEGAGREVCVTEMWDDWKLDGPHHRRTLDHPERYDFVDVSQNTHQTGQRNWDAFLWVREYVASKPRPINTVKTYGADGGRFGDSRDGVARWWRHLLGGAAAVRFHRPDAGIGLSEAAEASIRAAREVESSVKLWDVVPRNDLLSGREADEAYVAAAPGRAYVVYFPAEGAVTLELAEGEYGERWISAAGDARRDGDMRRGGEKVELAAPDAGGWVVVLRRMDDVAKQSSS